MLDRLLTMDDEEEVKHLWIAEALSTKYEADIIKAIGELWSHDNDKLLLICYLLWLKFACTLDTPHKRRMLACPPTFPN